MSKFLDLLDKTSGASSLLQIVQYSARLYAIAETSRGYIPILILCSIYTS
mgnify:CR=1 FL=1